MSEELFERYLKNDLDEAGARDLSSVLATREGARHFAEFVQEWTLLGEAARQRVNEVGRHSSRRIRKLRIAPQPSRAWIGWAVGLAAVLLFMIALATPSRLPPREDMPRVVRVEPPPPVVVPELPPAAPPPKPLPVAGPQPERVVVPLPPRPEPPPNSTLTPAPVATPPKETPSETRPLDAPKTVRPVLASLGRILGDVQVTSSAGRRPAVAGEGLAAEEGLEAAGHAMIEFSDGSRIEIGPDTTIERVVEKQGRRILALLRGTLTASIAKQPAGRTVAVATPLAEVTVLGTQFTLVAHADSSRVEVREGRVSLKRLPDGASIDVSAGHFAVAAKGQKLDAKPIVFTRDFQDGPGYSGTRDTELSGAEPSREFGAETILKADGDEAEGKKLYVLLKWDLSDLPVGAFVRSAVITLYVVDESQGIGYYFYEMKRPWSEAEATWKVAAPGQSWRQPGARSSSDRGSEILGMVAPRAKGEVRILLTPAGEAAIQSWLRNPASNHGFIIANDTNVDGFKFYSREWTVVERRPKLTVTYTLGPK